MQSTIVLTPEWTLQKTLEGLHIYKVNLLSTETGETAVSHSVIIDTDLTWRVCCFDRPVPLTNPIFKSLPNRITCSTVNDLLKRVSSASFCPGNDDFLDLAIARKGRLLSPRGKTTAASITAQYPKSTECQTVRSSTCAILCNNGRCCSCKKYRGTLLKASKRLKEKQKSPGSSLSSDSHTNFRYLNTPERRLRIKNIKSRLNSTEIKYKKWLKSH